MPLPQKPLSRRIQQKRVKQLYLKLVREYGSQEAREIINRIGSALFVRAFAKKGFGETDQRVVEQLVKLQHEVMQLERQKKYKRPDNFP